MAVSAPWGVELDNLRRVISSANVLFGPSDTSIDLPKCGCS